MRTENTTPVVLLVEDSEDDAFFFRRTLHKSGMNCALSHVTDGAQAIEFLRKVAGTEDRSFPQTMFLDLKMPVVNGFEVLEWVRTQSFPVALHVVVLSGSEQQEDKDRAAGLGAMDYLVKPVKVDDLQRLLRHLCPNEAGARV